MLRQRGGVFGRNPTFNDVTVEGNLTVLGATTTIESQTLQIEDPNILLGKDNTTDPQADGGGITLKGATNKTFTWDNTAGTWVVSDALKIDNIKIDGNTISATDTNGNLTLNPNGTGWVVAKGNYIGDGGFYGGSARDNGLRSSGNNVIVMCPSAGIFYHQLGTGSYYTVTTSGGSTSDARLKHKVQPIGSALAGVKQLRGVFFEFIEEQLDLANRGQQMGVIAQEIEAVFPQAVHQSEEGIKSVRYDRLVAPLIEAVKQLSDELNQVKAELAMLKGA